MSGRPKGKQMLAEYFARAQKADKLKPGDPGQMTTLFLELCRGELTLKKLWNVNPAPTTREIKDAVEQTVSVFLAAFGA